ncbi:MAG: hypothetical protein HYS27_15135 [Deltaproteobacteria bacterium]|nr:hypothetical protein [Deltaproteobacteria bacterium]
MLDIGVVLQGPTEDKDWLKKCALMGLLSCALFLVPLVGAIIGSLNLMGWMRVYADRRMRGEHQIPDANLGYLGQGWGMFVMYLPLVGLLLLGIGAVAAVVVAGALLKIEALIAIGPLVAMAVMMPVSLWLAVFSGAMLYLFLVDGEQWASIKFGAQWRLAMRLGTSYLLFWIALLLAGVIAQLGVIACLAGLIVTMPYSYLMQAIAIAELAKVARAKG